MKVKSLIKGIGLMALRSFNQRLRLNTSHNRIDATSLYGPLTGDDNPDPNFCAQLTVVSLSAGEQSFPTCFRLFFSLLPLRRRRSDLIHSQVICYFLSDDNSRLDSIEGIKCPFLICMIISMDYALSIPFSLYILMIRVY